MLRVDLVGDENFGATVTSLLSGLLPHEKFEPEYFGEILSRVFSVVKLEEMQMEYFIVFSSLEQIHSLMLTIPDSVTVLTRNGLDTILRNGIDSVIYRPELAIRQWLLSQGMPDDLTNEIVLNNAKQELYSRSMELYDRAFEMQLGGSEALATIPAFKQAFLANVSVTAMNIQREIIDGNVRIGRETFTSFQGWLDYIGLVYAECDIRLNEEDDNVMLLNDPSKTAEMEKALASMFEGIADFGIGPLDSYTPMMRHVLDVVAANEGVGKTTFMLHCIGQLLAKTEWDSNGKFVSGEPLDNKVVIMCGESHKALVWAKVVSTYIHRTRGKFFSHLHITGKVEVSEANKQIIQLAKMEIESRGNVMFVGTFRYRHVYREVKKIYDTFKFDALFIDHSMALSGQGNDLEKATMLAVPLRDFKKKYPVYIQVLSHLSSLAKELVAKGKAINSAPTRGGAVLSNEADDIFVLLKDPILEKSGRIAMEIYKRRNGPPITTKLILQVQPNVCVYRYDKRDQQGFDSDTLSAANALERLKETLGDGGDGALYQHLDLEDDLENDGPDIDDEEEWEVG